MPLLTVAALPTGSISGRAQPEITGDGVTLRPWEPSDRTAVVTGFADPAIQRWHCVSLDDAEAAEWISQWAERWSSERSASWAILQEGRVAGQIGLRHIDLHEGMAAISYWVLPPARGRRIAPSALNALTAWSFTTLGLHRLELSHSTANPASCRVADKSGYQPEGTKRSEARHADGWHDMHLHARLSTD
ncbi:GNAT family N-acetyltransferase [Actinoplanes couchii]|uniref:Acetyltransferase n=1 Tax=Actinoplanes couchii TaxID=403638 RepID=A0ABQ3X6E4_9ACTN|nr:GNAT family N-acetyltransferase [Actinoplanes couchii]MDR6325215.1 RimJ/RimL family protein N-acetyltransferase [Actinoplanes couchii]GID54081.1 acetyltransferase [Actinoplanes couchii]